jgi:hypothetical protein
VLIGVVLLIFFFMYGNLLRPTVSRFAGQQFGEQIGLGTQPPAVPPPPNSPVQPIAPEVIAALPNGEIRLTQDEANSYLATHRGELAPIEAMTVQFVPGVVISQVRVYGTDATLSSQFAAREGRLMLTNVQIEGPLSYALSVEDFIRPLEQQINNELQMQGRAVRDVRVEQGQLILFIEQR